MMIALTLVLFIISSWHSVNTEAAASSCYTSCQTRCEGGPPRGGVNLCSVIYYLPLTSLATVTIELNEKQIIVTRI